MGQTQRISKNNTTVTHIDGVSTVTLHNTAVLTVDTHNKTVTFNNGGWVTVTTAARMNQACNEFNLPYRIGRCKGVMSCRNYVSGQEYEFMGNLLVLPLSYAAWDSEAGKHVYA